ncbi:SIMPL domain-containing protein [Microbacterium sp. Marseille-Q6965]|uniref:SIMPL domain-containing protein n=1 Tax=Microbacterium sp. Marseille-Q6965 TaxID=2965072 RepID=UPI0021B824A7|nr:SIMPL domain-containing protein [Microbacterium sp. Marseille-Q6965]
MGDVIISVRGTAQRRVAPELAIASVQVRVDGPDRASVTRRTGQAADALRSRLKELEEGERVVRWSSERAYFWSSRPWNADGTQLRPVHYGSVPFGATFDDFAELSGWVGELAEAADVHVGDVSWRLTDDTRARLERETAAEAVGVAVQRAQAYAEALGLGDVAPVEIADNDLLSRDAAPGFAALRMGANVRGAAEGAPLVALEPEDILVSATVEGRFAARA